MLAEFSRKRGETSTTVRCFAENIAGSLENHGPIDPFADQPYEGDVGHPQLVMPCYVQSRDQVGVDGAVVVQVRG